MRRLLVRFIIGLAIVGIVTTSSFAVTEGFNSKIGVTFNGVNIRVNGEIVRANNILYNATTYVPLRVIGEMLRKDIIWDNGSQTAYIFDNNKNEWTKEAERAPLAIVEEKKEIEVIFNGVKLVVNGELVDADNILYNGTTYVPLRAIGEMLSKDIVWDNSTQTANIDDKVPVVTSKILVSEPSMFTIMKLGEDGKLFTFLAENLSGKAVKSYTFKISTYNQAGEPSFDIYTKESTSYIKNYASAEPGGEIILMSTTYQSDLYKIVIDEITLEFKDGTVETQIYGYSITE